MQVLGLKLGVNCCNCCVRADPRRVRYSERVPDGYDKKGSIIQKRWTIRCRDSRQEVNLKVAQNFKRVFLKTTFHETGGMISPTNINRFAWNFVHIFKNTLFREVRTDFSISLKLPFLCWKIEPLPFSQKSEFWKCRTHFSCQFNLILQKLCFFSYHSASWARTARFGGFSGAYGRTKLLLIVSNVNKDAQEAAHRSLDYLSSHKNLSKFRPVMVVVPLKYQSL